MELLNLNDPYYDNKRRAETTMQSTVKKGRRLQAGDKTSIQGLQVEEGSGNVFADLGLPDAEERLAKSRLAALISESIEKKGRPECVIGKEYIAVWLIQRHPFVSGSFIIPATTMITAP